MTKVWLYPCTIVGYVRLILLLVAIAMQIILPASVWLRVTFGALIGASLLLDLLDGYLSRKFEQTTTFGQLFDLIIDLITHTTLWLISGFPGAIPLIVLEWLVGAFIATRSLRPESHWKTTLTERGPRLIKAYFAHNQRNLLSAYGNVGHVVFPMALYLEFTPAWVAYAALPGLILYEVVTVYMLAVFLRVSITDSPSKG